METMQRLDTSNAEHIIYTREAMEITVLGGLRLEGLDRMRVTVKIQVEHLSVRHNLDLYNDTQVDKLVRKVAEASIVAAFENQSCKSKNLTNPNSDVDGW